MDTMMKLMGWTAVATFIALTLCMVNEVGGTVEPYGDTYTVQVTRCSETMTVQEGSTYTTLCTASETVTETRQPTHVKGLFWSIDSFRVVR